MAVLSDIEIAQAHEMKKITEIAAKAGIDENHLELYGKYKAKLDLTEIRKLPRKAKLILVTAISPTPAGEGKTTTSVGLADALNKLGKNTMVCLREPSLGPVFGVKGGAAGGGYAQVVPMEDINLHFTGDFHAIGAANNLLAAMLDNHIQQGNALGIDPRRIVWKRAVDMNDRQLRHIIDGLGGKASGVPREDGFEITVASEVMAVLCLATGQLCLPQTPGGWGVAFLFSFAVSVGAVVLFQEGTFLIGAQLAAILSTFEPITSIFFGILFLNETLTPRILLGSAITLLAGVLITVTGRKSGENAADAAQD